jgi:hypothetical protein
MWPLPHNTTFLQSLPATGCTAALQSTFAALFEALYERNTTNTGILCADELWQYLRGLELMPRVRRPRHLALLGPKSSIAHPRTVCKTRKPW